MINLVITNQLTYARRGDLSSLLLLDKERFSAQLGHLGIRPRALLGLLRHVGLANTLLLPLR